MWGGWVGVGARQLSVRGVSLLLQAVTDVCSLPGELISCEFKV